MLTYRKIAFALIVGIFALIALLPVPAVTASAPASGAALSIPSLDIYAAIVPVYAVPAPNGRGLIWDVQSLGDNVGHLQGTTWLDKTGNIGLAGHATAADGAPSVFNSLPSIQRGDSIIVIEGGIEREYRVIRYFHTSPSNTAVMGRTTTDTLTLVTCSGYSLASRSYQKRFIVVAERVQ